MGLDRVEMGKEVREVAELLAWALADDSVEGEY